jgi:hypothetical protein
VEENTGDPSLEWTGTYQEGLAQSMLKTVRYVLTGDMGKFKNDKLLQKRFMYGVADGILMMIIFGILSALIKGWIADNGSDGISGETMAFIDKVNDRVLNESNIMSNTFGALNTTPAFISYGNRILTDIGDVFEGDKVMSDLSKHIKAINDWNK